MITCLLKESREKYIQEVAPLITHRIPLEKVYEGSKPVWQRRL